MNNAKNSLKRLLDRRLRPSSSIVLVALIALIFLLNIGLVALETQFGFSADLSANHIYTLSADSRSVLSELTSEIYLYPVYSPGNSDPVILQLLGNYAAKSSKVHLKNLPADTVARQFSLSHDAAGVVIASQDGSMFRFIGDDELYRMDASLHPMALKAEAKITSAILGIDRGAFLQICALTGHNELKISDLSSFSGMLEAKNFSVLNCDLASYTLNPSTDILLIAAPKTDLTESEYVALREFMSLGGRTLFLMENASFNPEHGVMQIYVDPLPRFESLLAQYGLSVKKNLVVSSDPSKINLRATSMSVRALPHVLTEELKAAHQNVVLSEMSSIEVLASTGHISVSELLRTDSSCYEKKLSSGLQNLRPSEGDVSGDFLVGAAAESGQSRLVLVTSSSLVTGRGLSVPGNRALLGQVLEYLSPIENNLNIPVKTLSGSNLAPSSLSRSLLLLVALVAIPALLIYLGIQICYKKKHS